MSAISAYISFSLFVFFNKYGLCGKAGSCYQSVFLNTSWTDRRPEFVVNMTFSPTGVVSTQTIVNKIVPIPISAVSLAKQDNNGPIVTLYNITVKLCEILGIVNKIPIFNTVTQQTAKASNYSFDCPMKVGIYSMDHLRLGKNSPLLAFLYGPKRTFSIQGGLYSRLSNRTLLPLTTYKFHMKIVKKPCDRV